MYGIGTMSFQTIKKFETELAQLTGAPFAIMTDCCTNALELCFRYDQVKNVEFTCYTYLSIYQLLHRLGIEYDLEDEQWMGEYQFKGSRIWDSARMFGENIYRPGQLQCMSFGFDKPLYLGWGGAILTDDETFYETVIQQRYDGRNLEVAPWDSEPFPRIAYHMRPTPELAELGLQKIRSHDYRVGTAFKKYPDGRNIVWT